MFPSRNWCLQIRKHVSKLTMKLQRYYQFFKVQNDFSKLIVSNLIIVFPNQFQLVFPSKLRPTEKTQSQIKFFLWFFMIFEWNSVFLTKIRKIFGNVYDMFIVKPDFSFEFLDLKYQILLPWTFYVPFNS